MIIIDQETDIALANRLERIKATSESARCIYFNLKGNQQSVTKIKDQVVTAAKNRIPSVDAQIYLCDDGDIFIIAPTIIGKGARELILDIATQLDKPACDEWVRFVELPLHINHLIIEAEAKVQKIRKAEEEKRKLLEQQQQERRRQSILNGGTTIRCEEIKNRRNTRHNAEIMIIEDDSFSRRLVENVLQKKYSLTGLGEATYALDTYARLAPDLLFLDINLPDVTGHELLEKIIALDPEAHIIMLSGNCDRENITQAINKGAKGFLAKPFAKDKLLQYIERCPTIQHNPN
jgi:two-component system chemotaxis response regulator CheY